MSYTPKTEEQLIREGLMPDGVYDFEVIETDFRINKNGNPMYVLKLHVFDSEGNPRVIDDYISLGSNFGERKFRRAADTCNILEIYNSGNLQHEDFKNKTGKASIRTEESAGYNPKNSIKEYIKRENFIDNEATATKLAPKIAADLDDEIPF